MKQSIEINQVIEDVKNLFNIRPESSSSEENGSFLIDKGEFERDEVLFKLSAYFSDRVINGGACVVSPITLLYTSFKIGLLKELGLK